MQKDNLVYAGHMLDTARKALRLVRGKSRSDYDQDETLSLALTHLLQVIGEAATKVSVEGRSSWPGIPWQDIRAMRNRLTHAYFDINLDIVWNTITEDLPPFIAELEKILSP